MHEVHIGASSLEHYRPVVSPEEYSESQAMAEAASRRWADRRLWNISSTAVGGGVAEMLRAILPYSRGIGLDMRWLVLEGSPEFFHITKRLHNALHGAVGDGSPLGESERTEYEAVLRTEMKDTFPLIRPRDLVLLHDPQTAGLIPALLEAGALVVWRCHIGNDSPNDEIRRGWAFLEPYVNRAHATVFSRQSFVPSCCGEHAVIIHPSFDPFSPKNQPMDGQTVRSILAAAGLTQARHHDGATFTRSDGSLGHVLRTSRMVGARKLPSADDPLVVQVSRWDTLKDPVGVMTGFTWMLETSTVSPAVQLVLAGPDPDSVADDPEGRETFNAVVEAHSRLPDRFKERIHLAALPMDDPEENAAIVNALQRHAAVVVQKSLAEGFGLTVTEAMAKGRPILASAVGGILEQIEDGVHGRLLRDPRDPAEFATLLASLLHDRATAEQLGTAAHTRAFRDFSGLRSLRDFAHLFESVDGSVTEHGMLQTAQGVLRRAVHGVTERIPHRSPE